MFKHLFVLVACFFAVLYIIVNTVGPQERVYDCGMAEWHPDIPNEVKEECRKLRYERWKEENERKTNKGIHADRPNVLRT